jgi:hypothetical protein
MSQGPIIDLDDLDKKIAEQRDRLDQQPRQDKRQVVDEGQIPPFTKKMYEAFQEEIGKTDKCHSCNYMNYGNKIIQMSSIQVMNEALPVPTIICGQCGSLFVPKWVRKVLNQAIEAENKIVKARQEPES